MKKQVTPEFSKCWCSKTLVGSCEVHGPSPLKTKKRAPAAPSMEPGYTGWLAPGFGLRQVLNSCKASTPEQVEALLRSSALDEWTRQLAKALDVNFEELEARKEAA